MFKVSVKNFSFLVLFTEALLVITIVLLFVKEYRLTLQLDVIQEARVDMLKAVDQLRQSSDDLTSFARMYIVTEDEDYLENFYTVLKIRSGEVARPQKYNQIYWDYSKEHREKLHPLGETKAFDEIIEELPFTQEEREKIMTSYANSNRLAEIEKKAFETLKQGDYGKRLAIEMLYSKEYLSAKQLIMKPIDELIIAIDDRTYKSTSKIKMYLKRSNIYLFVALSIFILNIYFFYIMHKKLSCK